MRNETTTRRRRLPAGLTAVALLEIVSTLQAAQEPRVGRESGIQRHLQNGQELTLPTLELIEHGRMLFAASWTESDGAGRPMMNGTGTPIAQTDQPLRGARAFNRISGPDANSCRGCHNEPYSIVGGSGDFVSNGFEQAERLDYVTFGRRPGASPETRVADRTLATVGNSRATPGLFGAGYIEMLARQMSKELQRTRNSIRPGQSKPLLAQGVSFGVLARFADGSWDTTKIEGLPVQSVRILPGTLKPSVVIRPWRQSGGVASLREFINTSYHRHLGIQPEERFGPGLDPDGDGVVNELTRADVTAVATFLATMPVPGRVIPNDPEVERAIRTGERVFAEIGCTSCHVPSLRLLRKDWVYSEPNPFNAPGNLQEGAARAVKVDLTNPALPKPRLMPEGDFIEVPAYTDFKLHDITDASDPLAADPFDMNEPPESLEFAAGNRRFLTSRLWGLANQSPYFHHGQFTTMRQAILAHAGEALAQRNAFERLGKGEQDGLIEFLKSLQVLPPSARSLVVDEHGRPKPWPRAEVRH